MRQGKGRVAAIAAAVLVAIGLGIWVAGFLYDVLFAGIPYQDETAELAARYAFHAHVASVLYRLGVAMLGVSAAAGVAVLVLRLKRAKSAAAAHQKATKHRRALKPPISSPMTTRSARLISPPHRSRPGPAGP